ncbi:MAG: SLBB domain-containing protein [Sphingomonas bacterium]
MILATGFADAQTAGQTRDPTVPYGSPLATPDYSQTNSQQSTSDAARSQSENTQINPVDITDPTKTGANENATTNDRMFDRSPNPRLKPLVPSEFEIYLERTLGRKVPRFGADMLLPSNRDYAVPATATVPADYSMNVGDTVSIALTGSVEGSVDVVIDTDGKIFLPKVGSIMLTGVRYRDLKDVISRAVGRQYRGYTVTIAVKKLHGITVYVTGYANNPGAYSVNSLSTMVNAVLAAGGPSSGGSLRSARLYRNGQLVGDLDLYDLILKGDRSHDEILQNEDVISIPPLGAQAAVTGSVNAEAVYELKPGETLERVIGYAGGTGDLADSTRVLLYRLTDAETLRGREIARSDTATALVEGGDILQVLAKGTIIQPMKRQGVVVRLEGEVERPGNYYVAPNTPLDEVMTQAGGLTNRAFVFGTRLERNSVKLQQRDSYREAIDQLEQSVLAAPLSNGGNIGADNREEQLASARAILEKLRRAEPDGRVVLNLTATSTMLPGTLLLENNDRIYVPPRPTTVGVFGAVYRPASFLIDGTEPLRVRDYIQKAGGPLRAADRGTMFVVRANGEVLTKHNGALSARVLPGDVIFMPVKTQSSSLLAKLRDITTIIFQLGIGAAAFVAVAK